MPFYIYSGKNLEHRHENIQLMKIIDSIKNHYRDSDEYCYAFINAQFINNDIQRQYDLLLIEKSCISVIEMKSMNGTINGTIVNDKGKSENLFIDTGNKELPLSWEQICHQRSYLLNYMGRRVKIDRKMDPETMFRIDQYWVFNKPLNKDNLIINDPRYEKWLTITTVEDFSNSFLMANKKQPFSLSEDDIRYLAKYKFRLESRNINKLFTPIVPAIQKLSNDLIELSDQDLDEEFLTLKDEFISSISDDEYFFLKDFMININENYNNADKKSKLRKILDQINIRYTAEKIKKILNNRLVKLIVGMNNDILKSLSSSDFYYSSEGYNSLASFFDPNNNPISKIHQQIGEIHLNQDNNEIFTEDEQEMSNKIKILQMIIDDIKNKD